jgi:hypothetical protein
MDRVTEGDRVTLTRDVERFPHFIARAGSVGVVTLITDDQVIVTMDELIPGCEEWDNGIVWCAWSAEEELHAFMEEVEKL